VSERTRVTRHGDRQSTDVAVLHQILDEALVAHVGFVRDGYPVVLPMAHARDGDTLLLHGSTGGGMLRALAGGAELAVTVTLVDGLVYATSLFDSSMNYRSAMVLGRATLLEGEDKARAAEVLGAHLMPGRPAEVRSNTPKELAATHLLRVPLDEFSIKVRSGPPSPDEDAGDDAPWSGVLPLHTGFGQPVTSADSPAGAPVPDSVRRRVDRLS
jgi:nitroimidazol reductase NimA-like FMN-containing flavoprotein (pyridoxamine 5'-phosphate oxidase superfamily)